MASSSTSNLNSQRKRPFGNSSLGNNFQFSPAITGFATEMQINCPAPKRFSLPQAAPDQPPRVRSYPEPRKNCSFIYFPLHGTVHSADIPHSVQAVLERMRVNKEHLPDRILKPREMGSDGKRVRPLKVCWMKGRSDDHNWRNCPRFMHYAQQFPKLTCQQSCYALQLALLVILASADSYYRLNCLLQLRHMLL